MKKKAINFQFDVADDGGLKVNERMKTSVADIYAAGDACTASWKLAHLWFQVLFSPVV